MHAMLAYTPFLDPSTERTQAASDLWWLTLVLLALFTSIAYKAVRMHELDRFLLNVVVMTAQILGAMLAIGLGLALAVEVVLPLVSK